MPGSRVHAGSHASTMHGPAAPAMACMATARHMGMEWLPGKHPGVWCGHGASNRARTLISLWFLLKLGVLSICFFRSKSRNSNTRYRRLSACITSYNLQAAQWTLVGLVQEAGGADHAFLSAWQPLPHNVGLVELLQQSNFTDGCTGHTLILLLQAYLLKRYNVASCAVTSLVDNTIRALADLVQFLILQGLQCSTLVTAKVSSSTAYATCACTQAPLDTVLLQERQQAIRWLAISSIGHGSVQTSSAAGLVWDARRLICQYEQVCLLLAAGKQLPCGSRGMHTLQRSLREGCSLQTGDQAYHAAGLCARMPCCVPGPSESGRAPHAYPGQLEAPVLRNREPM